MLWLLAATGQGLVWWLSGCLGCSGQRLGGHCQPQKESRLWCASRLEAMVDPWLVLGEEAKFGPFLHSGDCWSCQAGLPEAPLALEGLAGLPELLGNL